MRENVVVKRLGVEGVELSKDLRDILVADLESKWLESEVETMPFGAISCEHRILAREALL